LKKIKTLFLIFAVFALFACAEKEAIKKDDTLYSVYKERMALVGDIKKYEENMGFKQTNNFLSYSGATNGYPICYIVSKFKLPYSYEDDAVDEITNIDKESCEAFNNKNTEAIFYPAEAVAGIGFPISRIMLEAPIARFLYLVFHEDFHEQVDLPAGIEEAVGDIIGLEAAKSFAKEKFGQNSNEYAAAENYADFMNGFAKEVLSSYSELEKLYGKLTVMPENDFEMVRNEILEQLDKKLDYLTENHKIKRIIGKINIAYLGVIMTYSRHAALAEKVFLSMDGDIGKTFRFFKYIDTVKPSASMVMEKFGGNWPRRDFIEFYEKEIVKEIEKQLEIINAKKIQ